MQAERQLTEIDLASSVERMTAGCFAAAIAFGSAAVAFFDPANAGFFPVCPLFKLTGLACPGCGLTRGFHALFHGDLVSAIDFNLLTPIWAVIFGWVLISLILTTIRGRGLPMWPTYPKVLWVFLVVLLVFGIARNIPIWPLTFLFP